MTVYFRNSITLKMTLLVLGGTSLVFSLVFGFNYFRSRQGILNSSEQFARTLALSVSRRTEQEFRAVAKIPENLGFYLETSRYDRETLLNLLKRTVEGNPEIFGLAVAFEPFAFDKSQKSFAPYYHKSSEGIKFEEIGDTEYFQQDWYYVPKELKTPVWAEPYFDEGRGRILMTTYSYPLYEKSENPADRKIKAVVTADVSLEWLSKLVCSINVGEKGYCFIVSDTGSFVAHPRAELITRESLYSLSEEHGDPQLREIGRAMKTKKTGFVEMGSTLAGEDAFVAFARIPSPGWTLGAVFPKKELFAQMETLHRRAVILAGIGVGLLLVVSLLVAASFSGPLRRMVAATGKVAEGDLNIDLSDIKSNDEVGRLAKAFTHMVAGLRDRDFIRDTFGRYLTREVVNQLLEHKDGLRLGGESREISMIMSDLRGFTALTAHMKPEHVINFLNRYLGKMVEILLDHRGTIDEILGDGILAFFGAPEPMDDHPARAVVCALRMQKAMEEINALNEADGFPTLEMGVAVNTGNVVVGNIGSERRTKYGAVGSQVNFTGRVESFTVGGQVLITHATFERIQEIVEVKKVLRVEMKGIPGTVELFDVRGLRGEYDVHLTEWDDTPLPLEPKVKAHLYRLNKKALAGAVSDAWITHICRTSATLIVTDNLGPWEDIRLLVQDEPVNDGKEIYAKTVSVREVGNRYEAAVRFTSVSPEVYKAFPLLAREART
ncbi:MAG TPA: adenylate/guanylate cyclase domain-containing protein [Desulfomonilaceae bacterium]|nr:adenylate/guanylate cyclase domain-containing protein [Desulfomonilaceae bacterium]